MRIKKDKDGYSNGIFVGFETKIVQRKNPVFGKDGNEILNDDGEIKYPVGGDIVFEKAVFKFVGIGDYGNKEPLFIKENVDDRFFFKGEKTLKYYLYAIAGLPLPDVEDEDDDAILLDLSPTSATDDDCEDDEDDDAVLEREVDETKIIEVIPQYRADLEPFAGKLKLKAKTSTRPYTGKDGVKRHALIVLPETLIAR